MVDVTTGSPASTTHYTAVIYFHGMGSQRRFEETSRLIDSLDRYLNQSHREGNSLGYLTRIAPQLEPGVEKPDEIYTHIRTIYRGGPKQDWKDSGLVRFHEVYWAPVMAGQKSAAGVLRWMLRQIGRPFGTLSSPWRERQRLRRASLGVLYERSARPGAFPLRDFSTLAREYDDFESPQNLIRYPKGSFDEFIAFLRQESAKRPDSAERREQLARAWRRAYQLTELRNMFVLLTLALALALTAGGAIGLFFVLLQQLAKFVANTPLAGLAAEAAPATWKTAVAFAVALAGFLGLTGFLTDSLGDVEAWATYDETDEKFERRAKVIDIGVDVLTQVLGDPRCDRAVIVSHSLGTTIAHDTLFALARTNRAHNAQDPIAGPIPLLKIEHFVTLGSPIDKVEYFFESYRSPFHRYRRIVESLRGDIDSAPFSRNGKPFIHWINFWDDGDPVSGALHSPAGREGFVQRVDNVHVASLGFPDPAASHSAYFNNRDVISRLFEVIYRRAFSFVALPDRVTQDPDWDSAFVGPAIDMPGRRRAWILLGLAIPWLALAALAAQLLVPAWTLVAWTPVILVASLVALGRLTNLRRRSSRLPRAEAVAADGAGPSEMAMTAAGDKPPVKA